MDDKMKCFKLRGNLLLIACLDKNQQRHTLSTILLRFFGGMDGLRL